MYVLCRVVHQRFFRRGVSYGRSNGTAFRPSPTAPAVAYDSPASWTARQPVEVFHCQMPSGERSQRADKASDTPAVHSSGIGSRPVAASCTEINDCLRQLLAHHNHFCCTFASCDAVPRVRLSPTLTLNAQLPALRLDAQLKAAEFPAGARISFQKDLVDIESTSVSGLAAGVASTHTRT